MIGRVCLLVGSFITLYYPARRYCDRSCLFVGWFIHYALCHLSISNFTTNVLEVAVKDQDVNCLTEKSATCDRLSSAVF